MCLILGLGLPRYLGGALKYADYLGLGTVVERADEMGRPWADLPAERTGARHGGRGGRFLSALSTSTVCEVQC